MASCSSAAFLKILSQTLVFLVTYNLSHMDTASRNMFWTMSIIPPVQPEVNIAFSVNTIPMHSSQPMKKGFRDV